MSSNQSKYYAFNIINCKVPHWKKGKITKEENGIVFLENCTLGIKKENLYTNEKEALMQFVREVNKCTKNNIYSTYGQDDISAYQKGKKLLLKAAQEE